MKTMFKAINSQVVNLLSITDCHFYGSLLLESNTIRLKCTKTMMNHSLKVLYVYEILHDQSAITFKLDSYLSRTKHYNEQSLL